MTSSSSSPNETKNHHAMVSSVTSAALFIPSLFISLIQRFRAVVYDALILRLTTVWYATVLERIPEHSTVLDVGIGTAGALIQCQTILRERNIRIVGIDYDAGYIAKAQTAIKAAGLERFVSVVCMSVYDVQDRQGELVIPPGNGTETLQGDSCFDAIYFSGSFSLLPDCIKALQAVSRLLKPPHGNIYITQTYQRKSPLLLLYIKPLLRYVTTIDFGQLITEKQAKELFYGGVFQEECRLDVVEHCVMANSVDNALQAAYLTVLQPIK